MKLFTTLLSLCIHTLVYAQTDVDMTVIFDESPVRRDTISVDTGPVEGYKFFRRKLETMLNGADSIGKKREIRLNNIEFIVGENGKIDSAWVVYDRMLLHSKIIYQLKATPWQPAESYDGVRASHQQLNLTISLTKGALKRHRRP